LIDDHLIVRSGFAQLLGLEPDLQVVAEFGSGREALAGLPGRGCSSLERSDNACRDGERPGLLRFQLKQGSISLRREKTFRPT
ncbi:hypothetical protein ONK27_29155, partial [Salmonella enterica subsp. enterica serovar Virginia]|nr:hypothetical protein [Salmonella enterica subsp. enterica serovar Virginia]